MAASINGGVPFEVGVLRIRALQVGVYIEVPDFLTYRGQFCRVLMLRATTAHVNMHHRVTAGEDRASRLFSASSSHPPPSASDLPGRVEFP